jgi:hypothetical protein
MSRLLTYVAETPVLPALIEVLKKVDTMSLDCHALDSTLSCLWNGDVQYCYTFRRDIRVVVFRSKSS